jgi:hypothetical protein
VQVQTRHAFVDIMAKQSVVWDMGYGPWIVDDEYVLELRSCSLSVYYVMCICVVCVEVSQLL